MILGVFLALASVLFALDVLAHRNARAVALANATMWTCVYIAGALAFAAFLWGYAGREPASLFLAGFVMEKALSVDNLMVFVAIFSYFRIAPEFQHRVLHYGILGAVVFRLIFVVLGAGSLALFGAPVGFAFGVVVLWSALKMWSTIEGDDEPVDYAAQWYARWARSLLPFTNWHVGRFFERISAYRRGEPFSWKLHGTTLLMCLVAIEISDVLFSFDSVPAVIAVTQEPMLVYSAMLFAILGLRMLYFVLSAALRYLTRLGGAVVLVLFFIGTKLTVESGARLLHRFGLDTPGTFHISPLISLCVVLAILAGGVVASILFPATQPPQSSDAPLQR